MHFCISQIHGKHNLDQYSVSIAHVLGFDVINAPIHAFVTAAQRSTVRIVEAFKYICKLKEYC